MWQHLLQALVERLNKRYHNICLLNTQYYVCDESIGKIRENFNHVLIKYGIIIILILL